MTEPTYLDIDDGKNIVCRHCGEEAVAIKRDFGIDDGHPKGVHRDERDCCSKCGEEL